MGQQESGLGDADVLTSKRVEAARVGLEPGTYEVDLAVRVHGAITVGEDTTRAPTASIPVKEVLALFIARSGCTRESAVELLRGCLTDALREGVTGKGAIQAAADIDEAFRLAVAELVRDLPPTPVRGSVRAALAVEQLEGVSGEQLAHAIASGRAILVR